VGRNKKKQNKIHLDDIKEMFDVKKNLKKLKRNSGYESYTESNISPVESEDIFESNLGNETGIKFTETTGNTQTNNYELELGLERLKSELKDNNRTLETKIGSDINDLKEKKLDSSIFWKIIGGLVTAVLIISGLIYTLSYSKLLGDVEKSKELLPKIEERINVNSKDIERMNTILSEDKETTSNK